VSQFENWPSSSYRYYLDHKGPTWLMDALERYPVIDSADANDRFDNQIG
jgi:hypothetical protein